MVSVYARGWHRCLLLIYMQGVCIYFMCIYLYPGFMCTALTAKFITNNELFDMTDYQIIIFEVNLTCLCHITGTYSHCSGMYLEDSVCAKPVCFPCHMLVFLSRCVPMNHGFYFHCVCGGFIELHFYLRLNARYR